jgi:circadian clock protein KaiB
MSAEPEAGSAARYRLRLIVAGTTPRSRRAIHVLRLIRDGRLSGRVDLEIVDIYQQPALAANEQVVTAPMLIRLAPPPVQRIISDLSDPDRVLRDLEIPDAGTPDPGTTARELSHDGPV